MTIPHQMDFTRYLPSGASLHEWQQQFLDKFIPYAGENAILPNEQREAFVLNAFPSAGKTWAQMVAIKHLIKTGIIDTAIVVVPSRKLKADFGDEALKKFGLMSHCKLGGGLNSYNPFSHQVAVVTYGQLANNVETFQAICANHRVMVSADEMHHLGETQSWGVNFVRCFGATHVRLLTTGTPFRSDGGGIPWVKTTKSNVLELTGENAYSYSYGLSTLNSNLSALTDGVATPVVFRPWEGVVSFTKDFNGEVREFTHKLSDNLDEIYREELTPFQINQLKAKRRECLIECGTQAFPFGTGYVRNQITAAHKQLMDLREGNHPHASGMIVCDSINHADAVAKVVEELTGTEPVVVHGKEPDYAMKLQSFQEDYTRGRPPWLISVAMVSEGVNINHMRVLVYMTTITAPMRWTQIVGRAIRYDKTIRDAVPCQEAYVYQYDDGMDNVDGAEQSVRIKLYAETLEDEKVFTVKRMKEKLEHPEPDDLSDEDNHVPPVKVVATLVNLGATGFCHHELFNGERYNVEELADYQILSARWHEPAVMCKHKIEQLPTELRQMWEHWLAEHNGIESVLSTSSTSTSPLEY